jgi:AI-2 transport protein TqsA
VTQDARLSTIRNGIVLLCIVAGGAALLWLRPILTPLVLALFLMVLIDALARALKRIAPRLTDVAAAVAALVVLGLVVAVAIYFMADNAGTFFTEVIGSAHQLGGKLAALAASVGLHDTSKISEAIGKFDPTPYLGPVAMSAQAVVTNLVLTMIYLGFLMASRHGFLRKVVILFPSHDRRENARAVFDRIRTGIERYVWVQTVTGALIAGLAWALMAWVGLDQALFWALFIFLTAYVPMIGAAVGILAPAAFALLQFPTAWPALELLVGLEAIFFLVGNLVLPRMQGRSLNLDPVILLLSLAFWSALWGLPGAFLSSPLTVMAMIILAQFPSTRWIAVLLSDDGDPLRLDPAKRVHAAGAARPPVD